MSLKVSLNDTRNTHNTKQHQPPNNTNHQTIPTMSNMVNNTNMATMAQGWGREYTEYDLWKLGPTRPRLHEALYMSPLRALIVQFSITNGDTPFVSYRFDSTALSILVSMNPSFSFSTSERSETRGELRIKLYPRFDTIERPSARVAFRFLLDQRYTLHTVLKILEGVNPGFPSCFQSNLLAFYFTRVPNTQRWGGSYDWM